MIALVGEGPRPAAFPFEPFGTNALTKGAELLLGPHDFIDKSLIDSDMLRNALVMNQKFINEHRELAKRIMWAHMDAVEVMRTDKSRGVEVLKHYNKRMDPELIAKAYDSCGWQYQRPPKVWIDTLIRWMTEEDILKSKVTYEQVTDFTLQEGYPGYPGWEKLGKM